MCRLPTRTSNKACRRAAPNGMGTAVALAALPVDEFALAWDQTAPSPICVDWLGVDARGFELHEGDADKELDLLDMLASDNEDAVPEQHQLLATPLVGEPVIVKPEVTANSSQADVASVVPGSGSVGGVYMPQPTAYYQPVQHVYQPVPEMFGLSCSMHQPMPVVPAQFLPTAAPAAEVVVREETARQEEEEEKKDQPRSRRNRTAEELAANEERVKKRRRESAQRSRARKNCYVKNLEFENRSLKAENDKLRALLAQLNPGMASSPPLSCTPTGHQMLSVMVGETDGHSAAPSR